MSIQRCAAALTVAVAAAGSFLLVSATAPANAGFVPPGFQSFCKQFPSECQRKGTVVRAITLTPERDQQMRIVNGAVNREIRQMTDQAAFGRNEHWTLPTTGKGDCEDLALLKRKRLIELGWPSSVLLMTVARDRQGLGHAVLTVVTDRGDYILDNRTSRIRLASATGYRYYVRQSASNPRVWVTIRRGGKPDLSAGLGPENMRTEEDSRAPLFKVADAAPEGDKAVASVAGISTDGPWVAQPPRRLPAASIALEAPATAPVERESSFLI